MRKLYLLCNFEFLKRLTHNSQKDYFEAIIYSLLSQFLFQAMKVAGSFVASRNSEYLFLLPPRKGQEISVMSNKYVQILYALMKLFLFSLSYASL